MRYDIQCTPTTVNYVGMLAMKTTFVKVFVAKRDKLVGGLVQGLAAHWADCRGGARAPAPLL
jgi:hypothetical protein